MELDFSDLFVNPVVLFIGVALGAVGVWYAMPRRARAPRELGALIAAIGVGLVFLGLLLRGAEAIPNVFFYVFSLIGLGSALRVITHPRPVYAALFFILTVISSAGLFVLLSAEFLTFALIIIYAGAILITYLFVIMLATQASTAAEIEELPESDTTSRNPMGAVVAGFLLLAALTGLFNTGLKDLPPPGEVYADAPLELLPLKVKRSLVELGFPESLEVGDDPTRSLVINARPEARFLQAKLPYLEGLPFIKRYYVTLAEEMPESRRDQFLSSLRVTRGGDTEPMFAANEDIEPLPDRTFELFNVPALRTRLVLQDKRPVDLEPGASWTPEHWTLAIAFPETLEAVNLEHVGLALLAEHPLALELAGVILLMALVGAVVIARKQIELSEEETEAAAGRSVA